MKKLMLLLCLLPILAMADNTYQFPYPVKYQNIKINNNQILHKYLQVKNKQQYYTITINYPLLKTGYSYNEFIHKKLKNLIQDFKKNISPIDTLKKIHKDGLPLNVSSNTLNVNYQVENTKNNLISIRFLISTYYLGAAHPNSYFMTVNYNLNKEKPIKLKDELNPGALKFIADYSFKQLKQKLIKSNSSTPKTADNMDLQMLQEGTQAKIKNYQNWNITPEGMLINFNPYQVAAYVFGPQYVMIPYKTLEAYIKPDSVLKK